MTLKLSAVLTLLTLFLFAVLCRASDLPDACGDDAIHFIVNTEDIQQLPPISPGKAQVVFIESVDQDFCPGCNPITTRAAIDGVWLGANKQNSYFVSEIGPGRHKVCADWQRVLNLKVHVISLDAQAGQTYFILTRVTNRKRVLGEQNVRDEKVRLYLLSDSDGRRFVEKSVHSFSSVSR